MATAAAVGQGVANSEYAQHEMTLEEQTEKRFRYDEATGTVEAACTDAATTQLVLRVDSADAPPMLGETTSTDQQHTFRPMFPLIPGQTYVAELIPANGQATTVQHRFTVPEVETPPTTLTNIYPSTDRLPENHLKFYLHFTGPMSRGQAYKHITLQNLTTGTQVIAPSWNWAKNYGTRAAQGSRCSSILVASNADYAPAKTSARRLRQVTRTD